MRLMVTNQPALPRGQRGFFLLEALIVMLLLGFLAFGFTQSAQLAIMIRGKAIRHAVAAQLATDKLEQLSGVDPTTLSDANDSSETLVVSGRSFRRSLDVTVNPDNSRTLRVEVRGSTTRLGGSAVVSTTLALWGNS